jgi:hypothetical protein
MSLTWAPIGREFATGSCDRTIRTLRDRRAFSTANPFVHVLVGLGCGWPSEYFVICKFFSLRVSADVFESVISGTVWTLSRDDSVPDRPRTSKRECFRPLIQKK